MKTFNPYKQFVGSYIPNCLMRYKGLTALEKLLWARLAQYAGETGVCYPKQETLAEELGVSRRHIIGTLKSLVNKGFLEVEKASGKDKLLHKSNRYTFIYHEVFEVESSEKGTFGSEPQFTSGSGPQFTSKERRSLERESLEKKAPYSPPFLEFWELYPKKVGKGAAWEKWKRHKPSLEEVKKALAWQVELEQWKTEKGKFIPHPATYIHQRRWEDEPKEERSKQERRNFDEHIFV